MWLDKENPISVYIEMALIKLLDWEVISESKYKKYQSRVVKKVTMLKTIIKYVLENIMDTDKRQCWNSTLQNLRYHCLWHIP